VLTIKQKNPQISVESQMEQSFSGKSVWKLWTTFRGCPLFPYGTEQRKFPYHLVNFPVSSLSSAENNYEKSNYYSIATYLANEINTTEGDITGPTAPVQITFPLKDKKMQGI